MLRLEKITKIYPVKGNPVTALKGISLCFRRNEFVSILGPSGCGKTTTLNIIGGLDHYTEGDLIINGISTKQYGDRDWDTYRNHRIGFIFQSYNLIPHENILENVELALTIGGIGKEERISRAKKALDEVGLKDMYHKKPNQLSGGQCQRVAIARALVNEPEILLADEPTGALDSGTSVQIMNLIKEISKEKLVIMVTHNPDLAKQYSTRIIELLDGEVKSDSNPYSVEKEKAECASNSEQSKVTKPTSHSKMSWWTAFKLSAKNLWSKSKRTMLIVMASSIGIVGVSAVLAVSQGVRGYIDGMQDDMLSGNPVAISESGYNLTSLVSSLSTSTQTDTVVHSYKDGKIDVQFMLDQIMKMSDTLSSTLISNEITPEYEDFINDMPSSYYAAINKGYGIDIKNNIYTKSDVHLQGHTDDDFYSISGIVTFCQNILESVDEGAYAKYSSLVETYTDAIDQCLDNQEYVLSQYDVVSGKYATKEDEVMIVLNHKNQLTEFMLTLLGYYSQDMFTNAIYHYAGMEEKVDQELWQKQQSITVSDLVGKEFYYYPNNTVYTKNEAYGSSFEQDSSCYQPYLYSYLADPTWTSGTKMKVVGVLTPKSDISYGCLDSGFYYTPAFAKKYLTDNEHSEVSEFIKDFLEQPANKNATGYSSMVISAESSGLTATMIRGLGYDFNLLSPENKWIKGYGLIGSQSSLSSLFSSIMGGTSSGSSGSSTGTGMSILKSSTLTPRATGGESTPSSIDIYPRSFEEKYLVTNYLDKWNQGNDITLSDGSVIKASSQTKIVYTDNLQVVISMINSVIDIVTIALVCFTALSLVVSTVMIGIITYVSVMERVKEIGVIRSLGGRKSDVSHLFNAETFMIGAASGIFGLAITYLGELILNATLGVYYKLGMIANLAWWTAFIVFGISILLTVIAGLLPSQAAARQDPVVALRTE